MKFDVDIYQLSTKFMADYPISDYPELMYKQGRPYSCLLIDTHSDYFICVPYRSSIRHNNAYMFAGTQRSRKTQSGLDYTKIVIIRDGEYLDSVKAVVDQDEYKETILHIQTIVYEVRDYVDTYIRHASGVSRIHKREYERRYRFSTLPYFHDIMGIIRKTEPVERF